MTSFLVRVCAFKAFDSFILIFPLYLVMFVDAGLSPSQISILLITWSGVAFAVEVPAGVVADRLPRKWVLAAAQTARAACFVVWWVEPNFWGFLVGLALWGIKSGFTNGCFEALVFDELKAGGRAPEYVRVIGRVRAVQALAVLAASLGAAATARLGYGFALSASLASIALAIIAASSLPRAAHAISTEQRTYFGHLRAGLAEAARAPRVLRIIIFAATVNALGAALQEYWPVFGDKTGLTHAVIALLVGGQNAAEAAANMLAHRLSAWSRAAFHMVMVGAGVLLLAAAGFFTPWATLLLIVYSGLMRLIDTVFEGRLQHAIGSANRATIGSVKGLAQQVGVSAFYMAFGPLAQSTSYQMAFMACGAATALVGGSLLAARLTGVYRRVSDAGAADE